MRFWRRAATIQLGNNRYTLDDLAFKFKATIEDKPKISSAQIELYNLSADTCNGICKGMPVVLCAGYVGDVGTVFAGNVRDFTINTQDIDGVTTINVTDCIEEWLSVNINKTYKPGMYAQDILDDLLTIFGIEVTLAQLAENKYYPRGRVCQGRLKDVLQQIVVQDCGSRLLIRTGQIIINPPEDGISTGYLLTPETGLLKGKKEQQKQDSASTASEPEEESESWLSFDSLLNYHIGCADVVSIQNKDINGQFLVKKITHEGSRDREWKTTLEVIPY